MKNKLYYISLGTLVVAVFAVVFWGYGQQQEKKEILLQQENLFQQSFYDLTNDLQQLEVTLSKAMVASTSNQLREVLANIWREANTAQQNLARIPLGEEPLVYTQKFLNQLGDFSFSLLKNEEKSPEDMEQLLQLQERANLLAEELMKLEAELSNQNYPWSKMVLEDENDFSAATRKLPVSTFSEIEDQFQSYPQLVYDGPFADENFTKEPKQLDEAEISKEQAIEIAKKFLSLEDEPVQFNVIDLQEQIQDLANEFSDQEIKNKLNKQVENRKSTLETYLIQTIAENREIGNQTYLSITKAGGKVLWAINTRNIDGRNLTITDAQEKAEIFLKSIGMKDFKSTGVIRNNNQAVVSFAGVKDNIIIYPDLIKVKIALDNGEVIGYDAKNYIYAHHDREIPEAKLSIDEAKKNLDPKLKIKTTRKAIIPLATGEEVLTYEFFVSLEDLDYLIYINVDTGEEEKILRVLQDENGILTI